MISIGAIFNLRFLSPAVKKSVAKLSNKRRYLFLNGAGPCSLANRVTSAHFLESYKALIDATMLFTSDKSFSVVLSQMLRSNKL